MHQVLFRIPVPGWSDGIPVQGFGLMLLLASDHSRFINGAIITADDGFGLT